ncbi:type II toxin-antitoxin system HicB family antitoxin [Paenibacillus sp. 7541]|uniref:type II toxin-antitoxin system HicB family antitoxin n=1 Tax=Paenibacillus sp. 7541 TaxID=2026236 RepID=UPI000BA5F080|nr:type II toxin-antitoxin system HicB family antitoxin [Paenibacillus sp. 7541]PAK55563.1 hypothetical protein CHH75_03920 [Paenibacillus sp. 7541]
MKYPAIFTYADDGISVEFPDLPDALTCGDDDTEALYMAMDCLALHLYGMETDGDEIPAPTHASDIVVGADQKVVIINVRNAPAVLTCSLRLLTRLPFRLQRCLNLAQLPNGHLIDGLFRAS